MLNRIVRVTPRSNYRLEVEFEDGISGVVDLSGDLDGEMFEPLRDEAFFSQVSVDEYGAISWPNGADLAPDALYSELAGKSSSDKSYGARHKEAFASERGPAG